MGTALRNILCIFVLLTCALTLVQAQQTKHYFKAENALLNLRKSLKAEYSLMENGIMQNADTRKAYFQARGIDFLTVPTIVNNVLFVLVVVPPFPGVS